MKLVKPIQAHGETVHELTFRELNGSDIMAAGFPMMQVSIDTRVDPKAISALISRAANIPTSSVANMCALDWTRAMGQVMNFFSDPDSETSEAA
jgi:hypothetical protein